MSDRGQRTEQPTAQRIRKAREEGRLPSGKEISAAIQFLAFAALVTGLAPSWWPALQTAFRNMLKLPFQIELTRSTVAAATAEHVLPLGLFLITGGAATTAALLFAQLANSGFGLAASRLSPDLARLNPLSQLRELPRRNRGALMEAALLLPVLLLICWAVVRANLNEFLQLPLLGLREGVSVAGSAISELLWKAAATFLLWGLVDQVRQRKRYFDDLKMTKQEVREEHKQNEGNPEVKAKIRQLRREMLRRRMMSEVPKATAVIVNPTHFAVALRYDMKETAAPRVIAKGKNYLALRIKEKAMTHQIPIIENPPLAQALYKQVEVGQEIPTQLYRAVAEVLAYVFRVMNGRRPTA